MYTFPLIAGIDWQVKAKPGTWGFNKSLANLLLLRGHDLQQADTSPFKAKELYCDWVPVNSTVQIWSHPRPCHQYEKSACLVSNSQGAVEHVNSVVGKAWEMFASRAYVHQYTKHGLAEDDFLDSFATLEQIIASYQNL